MVLHAQNLTVFLIANLIMQLNCSTTLTSSSLAVCFPSSSSKPLTLKHYRTLLNNVVVWRAAHDGLYLFALLGPEVSIPKTQDAISFSNDFCDYY
ncbi:MAG: hypothetical protein CXZ00_12115 [Acidobacteria bacterium]|nr:MAG: hypothetical protein CXZ00_12115 [Acidobacteriota bacterium]